MNIDLINTGYREVQYSNISCKVWEKGEMQYELYGLSRDEV